MTIVILHLSTWDNMPIEMSVSATEPERISDDYEDEFGQIGINILPRQVFKDEPITEMWETTVDLNLEEAKILRGAIDAMIGFLERKPRSRE